jgi:hypothetical protein
MHSIKDLKSLIEDIQKLSEHEQKGVFNIIKKYTNKYTENQNGVFIDIVKLPHEAIDEILNFISQSHNVEEIKPVYTQTPVEDLIEIREELVCLSQEANEIQENLSETDKIICGLDYNSNRKKDLNLNKKKLS